MGTWLTRVRAVLGIGSIWGVTCGVAGTAVGAVVGLATGTLGVSLAIGGVAGIVGFVLGTGFATVLTLMEGRRRLEELSPRRAGWLGIVVGAGIPLGLSLSRVVLFGSVAPAPQALTALIAGSVSYGLLTGVLAAGTVAIAQRKTPEVTKGSSSRAAKRRLIRGDTR